MSITIKGLTLIPSGRERRAELTWLTLAERRGRGLLDTEAFTGDTDLRLHAYRNYALGTHYALRADSDSSMPLDINKPRSVIAMMLDAFLPNAEMSGDDLLDVEPPPLPRGAIP